MNLTFQVVQAPLGRERAIYALHPVNTEFVSQNNKIVLAGNIIVDGHHRLYQLLQNNAETIAIEYHDDVWVEDVDSLYDFDDTVHYRLYHNTLQEFYLYCRKTGCTYSVVFPVVHGEENWIRFLEDAKKHPDVRCFFTNLILETAHIVGDYSEGAKIIAAGVVNYSHTDGLTVDADIDRTDIWCGTEYPRKDIISLRGTPISRAIDEIGMIKLFVKGQPKTLDEYRRGNPPVELDCWI